MSAKSILRSPNSLKKKNSVKFSEESPRNCYSPSMPNFNNDARVSDVVFAIQTAKNRIINHLNKKSESQQDSVKLKVTSVRFSSPQAKVNEKKTTNSPFSLKFFGKKEENFGNQYGIVGKQDQSSRKTFDFEKNYKIYGTSPPRKFYKRDQKIKLTDLN